MEEPRTDSYERVFLGIALTVTLVWAISNLIAVAVPDHPVPQYVNYVMVIVAGAFYGGAVLENRRRQAGDE